MNGKPKFQASQRLKRAGFSTLALILSLSLFLPLNMQSAFADPSSVEVQAQADEASARLAVAEQEMQQIGVDYQTAVAAHEEVLLALEETQGRIDAAELVIADTQSRLGLIASQQYRQGPYSFLDVLFGASSFEEFVSSWEYINFVNQENAQLIQTNKDARAEAELAYEDFALQEQEAATQEAEQESLMARAQQKVSDYEAEFADLSSEVAALVEQEQAVRVAQQVQEAASSTSSTSSTSSGQNTAVEIPSGGYGSVVAAAQAALGTPYIAGGTGNGGFDCSGLTQWCYRNGLGVNIGRDTYSQYNNALDRQPYSISYAQPGDVLWWPPSTGYTHVAIYVGGGQYIHAPLPGQTVCYSSYGIETTIVLRF